MNDAPSTRARLSLEGLSVGDAFGQQFFYPWVVERANRDNLPEPPWQYTDDTEMAMAIVEVLEQHEEVHQDELAQVFAKRFIAEPGRGYGSGAIDLLRKIDQRHHWRDVSCELFGGSGSYGNGGAMRVAPLGAWYAHDVNKIIEQARLSAEVTHAHHEGQVGAVAIALAASWAHQRATQSPKENPANLISWLIDHLEKSEVRTRIEIAAKFSLDDWAFDVAREVGCGDQVSAQDTVAFCLWLAAAHLDDFCEAMWVAARVGGDVDTNCAIVGGIIALSVGLDGIPQKWRTYREPLKW